MSYLGGRFHVTSSWVFLLLSTEKPSTGRRLGSAILLVSSFVLNDSFLARYGKDKTGPERDPGDCYFSSGDVVGLQ